jgi:hypothetical protein
MLKERLEMPARISFCQMNLCTNSEDSDGQLVLYDGALVAILVRLAGEEHEGDRGAWFLECGLGPLAGYHGVFATIEEAGSWIDERIAATASSWEPARQRA